MRRVRYQPRVVLIIVKISSLYEVRRGSMATTKVIAKGVSGFVSLTKSSLWKGKETGNYSITLTVDKDNVKEFKDAGARIGEYEGNKQVKMTRKMEFNDGVFGSWDAEGEPLDPEVFSVYGDVVKVRAEVSHQGKAGERSVYFTDVKLLEKNPEASDSRLAGDF